MLLSHLKIEGQLIPVADLNVLSFTLYILLLEFSRERFFFRYTQYIIFERYYLFKIGSIRYKTTFGTINQFLHRLFKLGFWDVL